MLAPLLLLLLLLPAPAQAERWRWPVRGELLAPFHLPPRPYAAGGHRGIDIAAPVGTPVRSACAGRVVFAGTVAEAGRVVSVACGGLRATYLELGGLAVRRGARVRTGDRLGTVGAAAHLHLGARRAADPLGYVDPLSLLAADGTGPPVAPAPARVRRRPPPAGSPFRAPRSAPAAHRSAPVAAWVGLALLAVGVPGLTVRRRRRRSQARPKRATASQ